MNRLFNLLILVCFATCIVNAENYKYLTVKEKNGDETSLSISNNLKLTFKDGFMVASQDKEVGKFEVKSLSKMFFSATPTTVKSMVKQKGDKYQKAIVYNADGKVCTTIDGNNITASSLKGLLPGIYTIKTDDKSIKVSIE